MTYVVTEAGQTKTTRIFTAGGADDPKMNFAETLCRCMDERGVICVQYAEPVGWTDVSGKLHTGHKIQMGRIEQNIYTVKTIGDVHEAFTKWLAIKEDPDALDVILASLLDRVVSGDPLWEMVVAPSGGAKSEIFRTFESLPHVFKLSNWTSRTIISGYESKSGTAVRGIYPLLDGKILAVSELSEVLTKNKEERSQIFSQLRDLYDGYVVYGYGSTGEVVRAKCSIGMVCGITSAIDMYSSIHAVLGERFLKVRPKWVMEAARDQAIKNSASLNEMRLYLRETVTRFFQHLLPTLSNVDVKVTDEQKQRIARMATFVAYMRTVVSNRSFREFDTGFPLVTANHKLRWPSCRRSMLCRSRKARW